MLTLEQARVFYTMRDALQDDIKAIWLDIKRLQQSAVDHAEIALEVETMVMAMLRVEDDLQKMLKHVEQAFMEAT